MYIIVVFTNKCIEERLEKLSKAQKARSTASFSKETFVIEIGPFGGYGM